MNNHLSDSSEQKTAEAYMLQALEEKFGLQFDATTKLPIKPDVRPDAIDPIRKVVVEVYARVGTVKGGQAHKIKGDILKLVVIDKKLGSGWRKILCLASNETAKYVQGRSWVAEAAKIFNIEIQVIELSEDLKKSVLAAQKRQCMVNPSQQDEIT